MDAIKCLYSSFLHSFLIYGNTLLAISTRVKLKKLASKQKQAIKMNNSNKCYDIRGKISEMKILNVHKTDIYQVLNFV